jgi:hypothetical protein
VRPRVGARWERGTLIFNHSNVQPTQPGSAKILWWVRRDYRAAFTVRGQDLDRRRTMRFSLGDMAPIVDHLRFEHPERSTFAFPSLLHIDGDGCFLVTVSGQGFRYELKLKAAIR